MPNGGLIEFKPSVMQYIDNVDSEGGPFLIADATIAREWRGSDGDGSDYECACQVFSTDPEPPGALIAVGLGQALLWELYGAGTGDVFVDERGNVTIIRAWLDEPDGGNAADELRAITALVLLPLNEPVDLGSLEITSGVLAILWSPESGECIESLDVEENERPTGEMATDSSGLLVRVAKGSYSCLHDEFELADVSARRCHLVRKCAPLSPGVRGQ